MGQSVVSEDSIRGCAPPDGPILLLPAYGRDALPRDPALHVRVNIRKTSESLAQRYGRDALPRDPAWHVSKLVFGFSHGRSHVCTADMAFVRVFGRATPDRAGARPYQSQQQWRILACFAARILDFQFV